jgi:hypothetical protein
MQIFQPDSNSHFPAKNGEGAPDSIPRENHAMH